MANIIKMGTKEVEVATSYKEEELMEEMLTDENKEYEFELSTFETDDMKQRKDFYQELFIKKEYTYTNKSNEEVREYHIMSSNVQFQTYIQYVANKYSDKLSYNEIISEIMFQAWRIIKEHELTTENNNWVKMKENHEDAQVDLAKLYYHMKKVIDVTLWKMALDIRQITKNGEAQYLIEEVTSLNVTLPDVEDARMLVEEVTSSYWGTEDKEETVKSKFVEWFEKHRSHYLTQRQQEFLDAFKEGVGNINGNTSLMTQEDMNMDGIGISRMIERISERINKAQEEFMNEYDAELLLELESLTDEYEIKDWVRENINHFKGLLFKQPFYKDLKKELRAKKGSTDNTFLADSVLMEHLEDLRKLVVSQKFYKKEEEKIYDSKERIKEYNKFAKNSDVTVYKNGQVDHIVKESPSKEFQTLNMTQMLYLS